MEPLGVWFIGGNLRLGRGMLLIPAWGEDSLSSVSGLARSLPGAGAGSAETVSGTA